MARYPDQSRTRGGPVDTALALAGWIHSLASDRGRVPFRATLLTGGLILLSVLPALAISLTPVPLARTFEQLRLGDYRGRTSWLRLEGDLRYAGPSSTGGMLYTLHDPADERVAVTVIAPAPLPTGHVDVTGQPLGGIRVTGTFEAFWADVPTEPARHDPWLLFAVPGVLGLIVAIGGQVGYPVMRRDRWRVAADPGVGETAIAVRRYGRIEGDALPDGRSQPCTMTFVRDAHTTVLTLRDAEGRVQEFPVLRSTPKAVGRSCLVGGCRPALELHAPAADVILEFDAVADRDRVAAAVS